MKKIYFIMLLACPAIILSCRGGTDLIPGDPVATSYYIQAYTKANRIEATSSAPDGPTRIGFRGKTYTNSSGKDGEVFRELSQRYGDTHFNRIASQDPPVSALFNEFTNIDIFSSEDFNGIPAGSSLGVGNGAARNHLQALYRERLQRRVRLGWRHTGEL